MLTLPTFPREQQVDLPNVTNGSELLQPIRSRVHVQLAAQWQDAVRQVWSQGSGVSVDRNDWGVLLLRFLHHERNLTLEMQYDTLIS